MNMRFERCRIRLIAGLSFCLLAAVEGPAIAQEAGTVFTSTHIREVAASLEARLKLHGDYPKGVLEERLDDTTRVVVRIRSGQAELHKKADDLFQIVSGHATLVTAGRISDPTGDDEVRGASVDGGTHAIIRPGDVIHIPAGVPHQVLLPAGQTIVYVLVKILR